MNDAALLNSIDSPGIHAKEAHDLVNQGSRNKSSPVEVIEKFYRSGVVCVRVLSLLKYAHLAQLR